MNIRALFDKNKYALSALVLLVGITLIYESFTSAAVLACRLFLCAVAALFLSSALTKEIKTEAAIMPVFFILSLISCNTVFLTDDIHILLSLSSFLAALFFIEKCKILTCIFAGLCVAAQPLTLLILVPTVIIVQLMKKQKLLAVISASAGVAIFVLTKLLENNEFYADQFSSYYLSVHIFHLSTSHREILLKLLLCSIPLLLIIAAYIIKAFISAKITTGIAVLIAVALAVFGFTLSENTHTVFMILVPVFAGIVALNDDTALTISRFFARHLFLFVLCVAFVAGFPVILGNLPYTSELFSDATFIIFREE